MSMWSLRGPALLILTVATTAVPGPAGRVVTSCWQTVPGPAVPAGDSANLLGVSMPGPSSGWAVGFTLPDAPDAKFKPLVARWDGRRWRAIQLPFRTPRDVRLNAVTALSPSNAWAVGDGNGPTPLIIHWNGSRWARVPAAPVPGHAGTSLLGVAAAAPGDIWAVGEAENAATSELRTVTEHWNGRAWTLVPSPSLGSRSALSAVAVGGSQLAWAVGSSFARTTRPFVLHWNGHTWQRAATPRASNVDLNGVVAVSRAQVWAVGDAAASNRPQFPYALRWNGHAWHSVPVPAGVARAGRQLTSVTAVRGGHLAAAGNNLGPTTTGALHAEWNGRRWSVSAGPLNGTSLSAITTAGHNLWTVGAKDTSASRFVPFTQICHNT